MNESLYQSGADLEAMYEKREAHLLPDIRECSTKLKKEARKLLNEYIRL